MDYILSSTFSIFSKIRLRKREKQAASVFTACRRWSRWQDLNLRPLRPERSALPSWATPRFAVHSPWQLLYYTAAFDRCQQFFKKNFSWMICKGCCTKAGVSYRLTKFAKLSQRLSNRVFHDACGLWIAIHTKPATKRIVTTIIAPKQYHLCFGVIIFPSFRHNCDLICCTFSAFFKGAKMLKSGHKIFAKRRRLNFAALF